MKLSEDMKGIFAAPITPFTKDNRINEEALKNLIEKNIAEGTTGFFVGGSSGECFLLSREERKQLLKITADAVKGRVKLIAHVGSISTDEAIEYALEAKKCGYDALSATAPYYYKFSPNLIKNYYYDISQAAEMPVIIYNFPGNTGVEFDLNNPEYAELIKSDAVCGVKHTNLNVYQLERMKNMNNDLTMYNGFDEVLISGLGIGADGAIGSTFNFMLPHYKKIEEKFKALQIEEARALQIKANNIMETIVRFGLIPSIKYILTLQGIDAGECRRPFGTLTEEQKKIIREILDKNLVV